MTVPACGCRYGGNQHAHWFTPCAAHYAVMVMVAEVEGITLEQLLSRAVDEYVGGLETVGHA